MLQCSYFIDIGADREIYRKTKHIHGKYVYWNKKKKRNETKILYKLGHQTDHTMSQVFNIHVNGRGNDRKLKLV